MISAASGGTAVPLPKIITLQLAGQQSLGIYHAAASDFLILMVNGGAQTKAGSHRMQQQLACHWQQAGFASLRFDFPGFGDAGGTPGDFIDHARYLTEIPRTLEKVFGQPRPIVLFGLCDGATAALLASPEIKPQALLLLNPWCRLQQNHARTMLKFYYLRRLISKEFWLKLLAGQLNISGSVAAFGRFLQTSTRHQDKAPANVSTNESRPTEDTAVLQAMNNWHALTVPVHLTLSGADLTAAECVALLKRPELANIWQQTECLTLADANHTLSGKSHLTELMQSSVQFLRRLPR